MKKKVFAVLKVVLLIVLIFIALFPIYWLIGLSIRPMSEMKGHISLIPHTLTAEHFIGLFRDKGFGIALRNSLETTLISTALALLIGLCTAYVLARQRFQFWMKRPLSFWVFLIRILPPVAFTIPLYIMFAKTGILNTKIGDDISFRSVYENYDAVFIAIGAQKTLHMGIPGEEELEGVYHGLDFLKRRFLQNDLDFTGKKVAVIGGGNTAIDSARTAVRLGAEKVSILYRRTREDMPADKVEIKDALEEGVEIRTLLNPVELIGENGKLKSIRIMKQNLGQFDSSGRRKAVSSGESFVEDFDVVIPAISQTPDTKFAQGKMQLSGDRIVADKYTQATSLPGVFVGGDAHRGPEDIVNAVHEAKVAVMGIDKYLGGKGELYKGFEQEITDYHIEGDIIPHNRFLTRQLGVEEAVGSFRERNLGMHELDARAEASRCLRCDRR